MMRLGPEWNYRPRRVEITEEFKDFGGVVVVLRCIATSKLADSFFVPYIRSLEVVKEYTAYNTFLYEVAEFVSELQQEGAIIDPTSLFLSIEKVFGHRQGPILEALSFYFRLLQMIFFVADVHGENPKFDLSQIEHNTHTVNECMTCRIRYDEQWNRLYSVPVRVPKPDDSNYPTVNLEELLSPTFYHGQTKKCQNCQQASLVLRKKLDFANGTIVIHLIRAQPFSSVFIPLDNVDLKYLLAPELWPRGTLYDLTGAATKNEGCEGDQKFSAIIRNPTNRWFTCTGSGVEEGIDRAALKQSVLLFYRKKI